jgi:hypothetical protein
MMMTMTKNEEFVFKKRGQAGAPLSEIPGEWMQLWR